MSEQATERAAVSRQVKVGEETYTIDRFKGFKAFRIGRMLTSLGEIGPEISKKVNEFIAEYRKQNVDEIERATLEFRYPEEAASVSEEAWKESGGKIRLANDPSQAEILAVVLPAAFDLAGEKIVDLLAWVVASDAELERKDDEGEEEIEHYIATLRKQLIHRGAVDELFDLAAAAQDVLKEQMAGKADQARSLLALVGLDPAQSEETGSMEDQEDQEAPAGAASPVIEDEETPSTQTSSPPSERPDSSTDSLPPTDGDEEKSSTESVGDPSPSIST